MTAAGLTGLTRYITEVSGYMTLVPCVQYPYSSAFVYANLVNANCQINNPAAVYVSCLCSKDCGGLQSSITSGVYSINKCTNGETSTALSVYSAFCSSATALAAKIGTDVLPISTTVAIVSGSTRTSLVTPTNNPSSSNGGGFSSDNSNANNNMSSKLSVGDIIAIVIPIVGILFAVVVGWWKRHQVVWCCTCGRYGYRHSKISRNDGHESSGNRLRPIPRSNTTAVNTQLNNTSASYHDNQNVHHSSQNIHIYTQPYPYR